MLNRYLWAVYGVKHAIIAINNQIYRMCIVNNAHIHWHTHNMTACRFCHIICTHALNDDDLLRVYAFFYYREINMIHMSTNATEEKSKLEKNAILLRILKEE